MLTNDGHCRRAIHGVQVEGNGLLDQLFDMAPPAFRPNSMATTKQIRLANLKRETREVRWSELVARCQRGMQRSKPITTTRASLREQRLGELKRDEMINEMVPCHGHRFLSLLPISIIIFYDMTLVHMCSMSLL